MVAFVLCTVIVSRDATGQGVPDQAMHPKPSEVTEPNAPPAAQDEQKKLFSVNIDNADIRDVLESLAYQAGLNLVLTEDIGGRVSLYLKDVTWQTAFNAVLQAGGCTTLEKGKVMVVSKSEETDIPPEKPLATAVFNLNFANAKDLEKTINRLISGDGKMGIDERLNSIIISDTTANLERIGQAIEKLDVKAPQVMIEALIVNANLTDELKMGVDWTKLGTSNNFFTQSLSATPGVNPFGQVNFSVATGDWSMQGLIDFIETHDNVRVLANPKILVLSNHTATIKSVEEIPYRELSETSEGGRIGTTAFKEAGVTLEVTPQVTDDGYIIMHITPEQSAQIGTFTVDESETPIIESRTADTTLQLKDGQTIIIGGLRKKQRSLEEGKIPILGDIPFIGALFRKVSMEKVETELGVFITPHIYTDGELSVEESELLHSTDVDKSLFEEIDPLRLLESN